jgi:ribosomal protein S18 acetylase RimI-like enzyme
LRLEQFSHLRHATSTFSSGNEEMDRWFWRFAKRSQRDSLTRVFVLIDAEETKTKLPVLGYFALSMASVEVAGLNEADRQGLPRYPVPAVLMTRLAISASSQGRGLGRALMVKAAHKAVLASEAVAARLFVVDALNEHAARFYERFGFSRSPQNPMRLYIGLNRLANGLS